MSTFTEEAPIERGFAAVYAEKLSPELDRLEAERLAYLSRARRNMIWPVAAAVVLGGILFAFVDNPVIPAIAAVAVLIVGALIVRGMQAGRWSSTIYEAVMPVVCDFLGDCTYDRRAEAGFPLGRLHELKMLPAFDHSRISDRLEGQYRDTDYALVEAVLETETRNGKDNTTTRSTTFHGLIFRIGVPMQAPTPIVILRDWGSVGNRIAGMFTGGHGRGMPKVEIGHPGFEEMFEVHAEDPGAARKFLPPAFLDNLMAIAREEGGRKQAKGMRAAFDGGWFYLALDRRESFMEFGGLNKPVHGIEAELHAVFRDMALVRRIIDRLHGVAPAW